MPSHDSTNNSLVGVATPVKYPWLHELMRRKEEDRNLHMSIDLPIILGGQTTKQQKPLIACCLLDLLKSTLCHRRKFVNMPRTSLSEPVVIVDTRGGLTAGCTYSLLKGACLRSHHQETMDGPSVPLPVMTVLQYRIALLVLQCWINACIIHAQTQRGK